MYKIIAIIVLLVTTQLTAQDQYEKGMQKALTLWETNQQEEAVNLFERIAKVETENWLPYYYAANVLIVKSFQTKDEEALEAQLKKAQNFINNATAISKNNPEIMVLQALLHTAYVAFDGAKYGMTLSGKVASLYNESYKLSPNNPRVIFSKAEWDMGSARYFGQDIQPFCRDLEKAVKLFANFKPESPFHPNWGKERAEAALNACKK